MAFPAVPSLTCELEFDFSGQLSFQIWHWKGLFSSFDVLSTGLPLNIRTLRFFSSAWRLLYSVWDRFAVHCQLQIESRLYLVLLFERRICHCLRYGYDKSNLFKSFINWTPSSTRQCAYQRYWRLLKYGLSTGECPRAGRTLANEFLCGRASKLGSGHIFNHVDLKDRGNWQKHARFYYFHLRCVGDLGRKQTHTGQLCQVELSKDGKVEKTWK